MDHIKLLLQTTRSSITQDQEEVLKSREKKIQHGGGQKTSNQVAIAFCGIRSVSVGPKHSRELQEDLKGGTGGQENHGEVELLRYGSDRQRPLDMCTAKRPEGYVSVS